MRTIRFNNLWKSKQFQMIMIEFIKLQLRRIQNIEDRFFWISFIVKVYQNIVRSKMKRQMNINLEIYK